jgi:hypothetical protein
MRERLFLIRAKLIFIQSEKRLAVNSAARVKRSHGDAAPETRYLPVRFACQRRGARDSSARGAVPETRHLTRALRVPETMAPEAVVSETF